ncbi:MAG: sigma-70 family RNA polymerase sigma factor [Methanobrevibacter sp.]|nr:sigma-70 family RNA polymerase sigma factor [Methanobrevibacter sp.]
MEKILYKQQADKFLKWINDNYQIQKDKLLAFCNDKKYEFDEDIFSDTYLKIYDKIMKYGIKDDSDKGFDNYMFISFKINTIRDRQYARNQKRDGNVINLSGAYEAFKNTELSQEEKLKSDLYKDFATLYLLHKAEQQFDQESFYLFKLKVFEKGLTYKQLQEKTGIKGCRQKVVNVKNWLKENVRQQEVKEEFDNIYGDIL